MRCRLAPPFAASSGASSPKCAEHVSPQARQTFDAGGYGRQCLVMADIRVPAYLAETARRDGDLRGWLAGMPAIIAEFTGRWSLRVGEPFEPGGQCSWVARATGPDGATWC